MKLIHILRLAGILTILLLLVSASAALASYGGLYELSWFDMNQGSDSASGGGYEVFASIGQPDPGQASNGDYQLEGGFLVSGAFYQNLYLPLVSK